METHKRSMAVQMFLYRHTGGVLGGSMNGFRVLLLTTTGKNTGRLRTTPVGYINDGKRLVLLASNNGSDHNPDWYYNLKANPQVEVQVMANHIKAVASVATGAERTRLSHDFLQQNKAFADYPKLTKRELPLIILSPVS
jgi:deazaflavin-dependent oxidoreductase (nitroreductase family)